jgi:hypothetical protein
MFGAISYPPTYVQIVTHGECTRALSSGSVPAGCLRRRRDNPSAR